MTRFRGEAEDDARRGRERAEKDQLRHDRDGDMRDAEYMRRRTEFPRVRPSGYWKFEQMLSESGNLVGWNVTLDGNRVAMLALVRDDIHVFVTGDDFNAPTPAEIMAAFVKLYPDPSVARALPPRALPAHAQGSPFGPPRNWDDE